MTSKFTINHVLVDPSANTVEIKGYKKKLEPKAMALLCLLAEYNNEVVSKEAISKHIWPNVTVGDESIARLIFTLRNAIGDDAKKPIFIDTVSKRGYLFLVKPVPFTNSLFRPHIVVVLFTLMVFAALAVLFFPKKQFEIADITSITTSSGVERHVSINEKGEFLYVKFSADESQVFLKKDRHKPAEKLTSNGWRKRSPQWLDDDTFLSIQFQGNKNRIVRSQLNSEDVVLFESSAFMYWIKPYKGDIYFIELDESSTTPIKRLKKLNLTNGKIADVSDKKTQENVETIAFDIHAPSNKLVAADAGQNLTITDLETFTTNTIQHNLKQVTHVTFIDNRSVLVSAQKKNKKGLWLIDLGSGVSELLLALSAGQSISDVLYHDNEIYYSTYHYDSDLYLHDLINNSTQPITSLNTQYNEFFAKFLNEENAIVYVSNKGGEYDIWYYDESEEFSRKITHLNAQIMSAPVISESEKYLAVGYQDVDYHVAIVDLDTDKLIGLVTSEAQAFPLAFSFDDTSLYLSKYEADTINLYQYSLNDLFEGSLIRKNAGLAVYHGELNHALYVDFENQSLRRVDQQFNVINNTPLTEVSGLVYGNVKITEQALYYTVRQQEKTLLSKLLMADQKIVRLSELGQGARFTDLNPDETRLLMFKRSSSGPQGDLIKLTLVE